MSGLITTLLMVGLLVGGAYVLINPERRCNYLGICGAAPAPGVAGTPSGTATVGGCCECKKQSGKVMCRYTDDASYAGTEAISSFPEWFESRLSPNLQAQPNAIELAQAECDAVSECQMGEEAGDSSDDNDNDDNDNDNDNDDNDNDNNGGGGKTISSGTRKSTKSTTAKTGSQGNPGAEKKGVKNKNSSVVGSGQKIKSSFKFGGFANAYLTGDGRYAYYPNYSSYATKYYTNHIPSSKQVRPYYVRGNRIYTL